MAVVNPLAPVPAAGPADATPTMPAGPPAATQTNAGGIDWAGWGRSALGLPPNAPIPNAAYSAFGMRVPAAQQPQSPPPAAFPHPNAPASAAFAGVTPVLDGRISTLLAHGSHALSQGVFGGGTKDAAAAQQHFANATPLPHDDVPVATAGADGKMAFPDPRTIPWGHPVHAATNPHQYTEQEFINSARGLRNIDLDNMWNHVQRLSPAEMALAQMLNHARSQASTPEGRAAYDNMVKFVNFANPLSQAAMFGNTAAGQGLSDLAGPSPGAGMKPGQEQ